jgi:hypothetical protein
MLARMRFYSKSGTETLMPVFHATCSDLMDPDIRQYQPMIELN